MLYFALISGWFIVGTTMAEKPKEVTGDGYTALLIKAGSMVMGCMNTHKRTKRCLNVKFTYRVRISNGFYMMKTEVSQGLYLKIMGKNPSRFQKCGNSCPVEMVSWYDAIRFANALSRKEKREECYSISDEKIGTTTSWQSGEVAKVVFKGVACKGWRLPTEAEWEYAARGRKKKKYSGSNNVDEVGWHFNNSGNKTHELCSKKKNSNGLCDMSGNVWEWVWDIYGQLRTKSSIDPLGTGGKAKVRVNRGGSWNSSIHDLKTFDRGRDAPDSHYDTLGIRLCRLANEK